MRCPQLTGPRLTYSLQLALAQSSSPIPFSAVASRRSTLVLFIDSSFFFTVFPRSRLVPVINYKQLL
ncbi:hypothetical protein E2C01_021547 [Portunus trituberculatus]|uniref:Uncharacterized protein n=1 Tax=Portunus trituberculatus TaxID=210409 RepID=A0A5B7E4N5_PORTR|nr:hypothetical protein [Portunus trituberculatus]